MPYCIALLKKDSLLGKKTYELSLDSFFFFLFGFLMDISNLMLRI